MLSSGFLGFQRRHEARMMNARQARESLLDAGSDATPPSPGGT